MAAAAKAARRAHPQPSPPVRLAAFGLLLALLLALSLRITAESPSPGASLARRSVLSEIARDGWRQTLGRFFTARPMLGHHVREVPMPVGRPRQSCLSALDCSIEAAKQFQASAQVHFRRAKTCSSRLLKRDRSLRRAQRSLRRLKTISAQRHGYMTRKTEERMQRLQQSDEAWLRDADAKIEEARSTSLLLTFDLSSELNAMDKALITAMEQGVEAEARAQELQVRVQELETALRAAELRAEQASLLASTAQADYSAVLTSRDEASAEVDALRAETAAIMVQASLADAQRSEATAALKVEREARKSAEDAAESYRAELKAAADAHRMSQQELYEKHTAAVEGLQVKLQEAEVEVREQQRLRSEEQQELRAEKDTSQRLEQQLSQVEAARGEERRAFEASKQRLVELEQAQSAQQARTMERDDSSTPWNVPQVPMWPHQAVASLAVLLVCASVSAWSLAFGGAGVESLGTASECVEGGVQTEGPTAADVEKEWAEKMSEELKRADAFKEAWKREETNVREMQERIEGSESELKQSLLREKEGAAALQKQLQSLQLLLEAEQGHAEAVRKQVVAAKLELAAVAASRDAEIAKITKELEQAKGGGSKLR